MKTPIFSILLIAAVACTGCMSTATHFKPSGCTSEDGFWWIRARTAQDAFLEVRRLMIQEHAFGVYILDDSPGNNGGWDMLVNIRGCK